MKTKLTILLVTMIISTVTSAMIIRHDKNPQHYIAHEKDYPAVFPVSVEGSLKECVATLIAPKWAITAAHCTILINLENEMHSVYIHKNTHFIKSFIIHPKYGNIKSLRDSSGQLIGIDEDIKDESHDVALLELSKPVTDILPVALYKDSDEVGKKILLLGWGDFSDGKTGTIRDKPINDGKFRLAYNIIESINDNYLAFKFDDPISNHALDLEGVNGPGDSGGPALISKSNALYIAGISSEGGYLDQTTVARPEGQYGWQENYDFSKKISHITRRYPLLSCNDKMCAQSFFMWD